MRIKRGATARITLTDGTTIEGKTRYSWWSAGFKITEALFFDARHGEPTPAAGIVWVPRHAVQLVQVTE